MPNLKIGPPTVPLVLAKVPRVLIRSFDVSDLFMSAAGTPNARIDLGPMIAYNSIDSYLDAAKRQQRRIEQASAAIVKGINSRKHIRGNLFNEVHFYLICWARIAKLARYIADKTRFKRVGLVLRRYRVELKDRVDCRDHLEHFEERLPGGIRQNKLLVPNDLLNMIGDHVTMEVVSLMLVLRVSVFCKPLSLSYVQRFCLMALKPSQLQMSIASRF